jgi:hypothetical protein
VQDFVGARLKTKNLHAVCSRHQAQHYIYSIFPPTSAKRETKTYNSGDLLVVTHLTTNPPVSCLNRAERTGSLAFKILWSYVKKLKNYGIYKWKITLRRHGCVRKVEPPALTLMLSVVDQLLSRPEPQHQTIPLKRDTSFRLVAFFCGFDQ